ncbi:MAG: orotidine-5'-phosphate decarboxylase [Bacillota bacterium]|nr:orotidine-5'-phosphate decarboxylase [Bacillota bacterium]
MLIDRLIEKTNELDSPIIVGIDPVFEKLPVEMREMAISKYGETERSYANAVIEFGKAIIDSVEGLSCIVKPQLAYFEVLGSAGLDAYAEVVRYARYRDFIVIADAKRGDIGSTSAAYAKAFLGKTGLEADFITVNPYLGSDCLREFIKFVDDYDKGIFVLVKTSNPSSAELQDLRTEDGRRIYEVMGAMTQQLSSERIGKYGYSNIGAVVGATHPSELKELRRQMPSVPFLVPGYGAQGGTAQDVAGAFDAAGNGAYINSSRGIIYAKEEGVGFMKAMRNAAERMKQDFKSVRRSR